MFEGPIGVLGLGVCVPNRILSNADLEKMVDTTDEWIVTRTGIHERRILEDHQVPSDIAYQAAKRAIEESGVDPSEIGALIYCTYTPDHFMPPTACILQHKLGIGSGLCYDMNAACTGFIYGLQNAYAMIRSGMAKKVLVIGCDCASRIVDYTDRNTCILFGDGAGAMVIGEVPEGRGILGNMAGCDGAGAMLIYQKVGACAFPMTKQNIDTKDRYMQMNGREVFKFAVKIVTDAVEAALADAGLDVKDVDLLVPHQANVRIIQAAQERFNFAEEKTVITMDKYGNTSAASIPLALDDARKRGKLKVGTTCALVAFGAGLTYAASIVRW
ncbi:ketoacyl-ACP synthase III [Candidatus Sumerlaeota bacterium]|nr:ketoacyl-ACP synthase III [Candidatus Sumerlaeota bacterium]